MAKTFNCGLGGVIIASATEADMVLKALADANEPAHTIGTIATKRPDGVRVNVTNLGVALDDQDGITVVKPPLPPARIRTAVLISGWAQSSACPVRTANFRFRCLTLMIPFALWAPFAARAPIFKA